MALRTAFWVILSFGLTLQPTIATSQGSGDPAAACKKISESVSSQSGVFWPGSTSYAEGIAHYYETSSAPSACSVEPGSPADVGVVLQVVGLSRTPFAVKGGGHSTNPGFSSTLGVHISMARFRTINYDASSETVDVGSGLLWNEVYSALEPFNVTVVGGRVPGVGVAGLTLGGGYSWLTNEYGLAVDNVVAFEVVLPNGRVISASAGTNSDLFFALKGGYNNFGIVTQFTLKAIPIGQIWGGFIVAAEDQFSTMTTALNRYISDMRDPKAGLIASYSTSSGQGFAAMMMFYNNPTPPAGIFDDLLAIPSLSNTVATQSFASLVNSFSGNNSAPRGLYNTGAISQPTTPILNAIVNETNFWTASFNNSAPLISYAIEVFLPTIFSHAAPGSSAYPPIRSEQFFPLAIDFEWSDPQFDQPMMDAAASSVVQLGRVAAAQGQHVGITPVYGNYASPQSFSSQRIFGSQLGRLQSIKKRYDPADVMDLAGGWKV